MDKLIYGDILSASSMTTIVDIIDVSPVKYDGMDDAYIVCDQRGATHMLIRAEDNTGSINEWLLVIGRCKNTYLLVDALVE